MQGYVSIIGDIIWKVVQHNDGEKRLPAQWALVLRDSGLSGPSHSCRPAE